MSADAAGTAGLGPVVFAYDGSALAKAAVAEAGTLLDGARDALVLTVWQPYDVGFHLPEGARINTADVPEVRQAAELTAAEGAALAGTAGFRAESLAVEAAPAWKGIVESADQRDASLIVLGSHGRERLIDVFAGSVAGAVAAHSHRTVLIVHPRAARG